MVDDGKDSLGLVPTGKVRFPYLGSHGILFWVLWFYGAKAPFSSCFFILLSISIHYCIVLIITDHMWGLRGVLHYR